ncbi:MULTISPECIES: hypothetical protein [Bifidobacterium]|uniref:hypothetical protein n=1 Tax=Bifidobacterium TaxID=1678 RepID=UPI001C69530D|nr:MULTISPECIES: hypothetical protein [Bifidobacterium]MCX8648554.1 hypothetical protein [Bifidobacterium sp. B4107]MCX8652751.1 hypothetical protein [Bifidobacterium sp. B4111]MCX8659122.1 hypothetical protein [Bifidobacterium sp. B4114]MCX8687913.1 hypothetical protein [Bifidobacterium sp. B4142]QYN61147.1 hypothetical protein GYM67_08870 [Bifidobacterium asteroides]
MGYKENIVALGFDHSDDVNVAYGNAKNQLSMIRTANLEGPDRILPDDFSQQLTNLNTSFNQQLPDKRSAIEAEEKKLKTQHIIFLLVKIALIILGLLCVVNEKLRVLGFIMVIAGIICHFVFKKIDANKSANLLAEWNGFFDGFVDSIGHAETLHSPATGLFKKIDDLFLKSLDDNARGFEQQQRQMQKNMEAQAEQSRRALAAQAEQTQAIQKGMADINRSMRRR